MRVEFLGGPRDGQVIDMGPTWPSSRIPPDFFVVAELQSRVHSQYVDPRTDEIPEPTIPARHYPLAGRRGDDVLVYRHPDVQL